MRSELSRQLSFKLFVVIGLVTLSGASASRAIAAGAATTTTLAISSSGETVTSVSSGSVVTLTATVVAGSAKVTTGQVNFCDASVSYCTDIHLLGTAQLTSAGTATLAFRPGLGSHTYKAVFAGTTADAGSASAAGSLAVTGGAVTTTQIAQTYDSGVYSLTATVGGVGSEALTGSVSFLNSSDSNAVLGTAPLVTATPAAAFINAGTVAGGSNYTQSFSSLVFGDLNGDGIPDLAVSNGSGANPGDDTLSILLGNGDGTFAITTSSPATGGHAPAGMAVGDFNHDGKLDIAVANGATNNVSILLGNGDGSFSTSPILVPAGTGPSSIAVVDFNGDGLLDLAVANNAGATVSILLGNGDGTFRAALASPLTAANPSFIVAGDFNGDGKLDLAVGGASLTILLGNGDGSFTTAATPYPSATAYGQQAFAVGDFNGDGKLDLAIPGANNSNDIALLLGKGDGTFTVSTITTDAGAYPEVGVGQLLSGDFNGDGVLDISFTAFSAFNNPLDLLLGKGDGTFTEVDSTGAGPGLNDNYAAAADLNGDGASDVAFVNGGGDDTVSEFLAANQSATATVASVTVPPGSGTDQVVASYPGDSNYQKSVSAATTLYAGQGTSSISLTVSPNPVTAGASVTLTATVTGAGVTPTGTVSFADTAGQLGTGTLNGSGVTTFSTSALTAASYSLTAAYGGDTNYSASNSAAVPLTVTGPPATVAIPTPPAVSPGSSATATATFTAGSTYSGTFNLTCSLTASPTGAQSLPACSLKPTSLILTAGGTGASVLTVTTTAASTTASLIQPSRKGFWGIGGGGAVLAVLLMCSIPARRRRWMSTLSLLGIAVVFAAIGCGGGSGGTKGTSTPATTAGNYTFTVTGTDSANATITTSTSVIVTVN